MRLALLLVATILRGQDCSHVVARTPVGPMLVYRNGLLQKEVADTLGDYKTSRVALKMPVILPLESSTGDLMSVVFTRAVPLTFTFQGQTVSYWGYALWREDWVCK